MAEIHVNVIRAIESGKTYRQAAEEFGFHRQSVRRMWDIYRREGIARVEAMELHPLSGTTRPFDIDAYNARWIERIKNRCVTDANGCWRWQGATTPTGYGSAPYRDKSQGIHRVMYALHHHIELDTEQYVLHRCDVRNCCNPDHLFIGSAKVNNKDCAEKGRHYRGTRTHCPRGHAYDEKNTYLKPSKSGGMARGCKACALIKSRMRYHRKRDEILARQRAARAQRRVQSP